MKNRCLRFYAFYIIAILTALAVVAGVRPYKPLATTVTSSSTLVMKDAEQAQTEFVNNTANSWTNGTAYAVADVVYSVISNSRFTYWCTSAGTATGPTPSVVDGDDTSDAAVSWRRIRASRTRYTLQNDGADVVYLGFGFPAELNKGVRINADGGVYVSPSKGLCFQGDIFSISTGADVELLNQVF